MSYRGWFGRELCNTHGIVTINWTHLYCTNFLIHAKIIPTPPHAIHILVYEMYVIGVFWKLMEKTVKFHQFSSDNSVVLFCILLFLLIVNYEIFRFRDKLKNSLKYSILKIKVNLRFDGAQTYDL